MLQEIPPPHPVYSPVGRRSMVLWESFSGVTVSHTFTFLPRSGGSWGNVPWETRETQVNHPEVENLTCRPCSDAEEHLPVPPPQTAP